MDDEVVELELVEIIPLAVSETVGVEDGVYTAGSVVDDFVLRVLEVVVLDGLDGLKGDGLVVVGVDGSHNSFLS